jgi:non-ribosomal peptide synthase protein (TIGR01720 family)
VQLAGRVVPIGVAGELHIGGVQLARGYHGRPALSAEKFVPDPWSATPGGRLYRTGDLARWAEDGSIEYLGRLDHQVKIRGFRIELGEIESALLEHESVREAVVVAREVEHLPGDKRLVAYVALNAGYAEADDALRAFLGTTLPEHMLPALFVFVDALPLTPSGKLDRQALPAPRRKTASPADLVAPSTPVEEKLAAIWCEVLQLPAVGMHDNFFELGGDSILSIQIVAKAGSAGLQLKPNALFTHRTIAELASVVNAAPAISAEQGLAEGEVPLTPAQSLFFARDVAEPHHWNQTLLFELRERLAITALEQAVQQLILHHDALRMRFSVADGAWSQRNAGAADQTVCSLVDLGALPVAEQAAALEQAAAAAQQSLDLANGPLLRAALFDLGPASRQRLLLTIHHLVVDGVSWRILLEDLQAAYAQVLQGQAVRLPAKTSSYKQWAERLAAHAQSPELAGEASYWLDLGRRAAALPTDYAAHPGDNLVGSEQTVTVHLPPAESLALLQEVPAAYQTTINDVLLTALTMACAPWTGTPALSLYLEGHGREELFADIDLSRTVGWFTALYPVELALAAPSGPGESLKAIKEQLRRVPQRGIGYGLLRYLSGDRRFADLPEPQLCFNYLGQLDQAIAAESLLALAEESAGPARSPRGRRLFLLEVNAALVGGQLQVEWTFSDRFHQRQTIERLAERFIGELRSLIQHCQSPAAGGYTPSDFPDEDLNDSDLDAILAQIGDF